jgi:hypothetical protein
MAQTLSDPRKDRRETPEACNHVSNHPVTGQRELYVTNATSNILMIFPLLASSL